MNAIIVNDISKKFRVPREKKTTFFQNIVGLIKRQFDYEEFWALKDVSFEIKKGETLGIIGKNGSGKSTLLKILAKVLYPDSGSVTINSKVASFLELGIGFQPELTAQENVYIYSSILGMGRKEVERKYDAIFDFADLKKFENMKLKNFSSGMYMRLAFSTAVHTNPETLLIDEVFAVGDEAFQKKCMEEIREFQKRDKTIVFVSHDLGSVERICDRILLLDSGKLVSEGKPIGVISEYHRILVAKNKEELGTEKEGPSASEQKCTKSDKREKPFKKPLEDNDNLKKNRWGTREAEITRVIFLDKNDLQTHVFKTGEQIKVRIDYIAHAKIENPVFGIAIRRDDGIHIAGPNTKTSGYLIDNIEGEGFIEYIIDHIPLLKGTYFFTAAIYDFQCLTPYDHWEQNWSFHVIESEKVGDRVGLISIPCVWRLHG